MPTLQRDTLVRLRRQKATTAVGFMGAAPFGQPRSYPLMTHGVFDVDQIVWQRQASFRARPDPMMRRFARRFFVAPTVFLVVAGVMLVVPRTILQFLSSSRLQARLRRAAIRTIDVVGACVGGILSLPFLFVVPVLIKLDSPGPVFYRQVRIGIDRRKRDRRVADIGSGENRRGADRRTQNLHGNPFYIYKFRTMEDQAELRSGAVWAMRDDPRITAIGGWLRKFHVDEIPQFWNVLKGEMSLVGPRPERPELIREILPQIPDYRKRLNVRPGMTGLAQICMGYDSCLDDVRKKIRLDVAYLTNLSLRLHLRILWLTVVKIVSPSIHIDFRSIDPTL